MTMFISFLYRSLSIVWFCNVNCVGGVNLLVSKMIISLKTVWLQFQLLTSYGRNMDLGIVSVLKSDSTVVVILSFLFWHCRVLFILFLLFLAYMYFVLTALSLKSWMNSNTHTCTCICTHAPEGCYPYLSMSDSFRAITKFSYPWEPLKYLLFTEGPPMAFIFL